MSRILGVFQCFWGKFGVFWGPPHILRPYLQDFGGAQNFGVNSEDFGVLRSFGVNLGGFGVPPLIFGAHL